MKTTETKITQTTNTYDFGKGTLVKHFVTYHYPRPVTMQHYTVIKNGVESKKFRRIGNAMNFLDK